MPFRTVVVATDLGPSARDAVAWTARHLAPDATMVLVHVVQVPQPPRFLRRHYPDVTALEELARTGAERALQELARASGGDRVRWEVRSGRPAEQLTRAAAELGADAVVVGRHGQRGALGERLGSTAEQLLQSIPVPVLMVPGRPAGPLRRVLAAVEDTAAMPTVMRTASGIAVRVGARVLALHVLAPAVVTHVLSIAQAGDADAGARLREELHREADRWMRELVLAGLPDGQAHAEVTYGDPAGEILRVAERDATDLLVLGTRRPGALRVAVLGSVVGEVLRRAAAPVLVVPEPDAETPAA